MTLSLPYPIDFSFHETVHSHGWRYLAPFSWNDATQTLGRVQRLTDGCTTLITVRAADDELQIESSESGADIEVISCVRYILQMDLSLDAFHEYSKTRPELAHIANRKLGRMLRSASLFEDVIKVIATANTTWAQTTSMVGRLCEHFGSPLPGTSQFAFPTHEQIAQVPFDEFAAKARMGYRNAYAHKVATQIVNGEIDLESWANGHLPTQDLRKHLLSLPGIGPYGAACLLLYMGHGEYINVDSWARMLLSKELNRPVTDKDVHSFFEPYGEWRGLVYNFYRWKNELVPDSNG